ncbi:hypothetical protein HDV02_001787 [Globomyces sp. JEL0801]|nr:hypothetical protein HDV02_001787 [Globomyces sp. JEL0801]
MISQAKNSKSSKTTGNPVSEKSQLPYINNIPNTPDSNSISPRRLPNVNEKSRKQSLGVDNDTSHNQPKTRRQSNVISFSEFKKQKEKELNLNKLKLNELVVDNLEDDNIVKLKLPIPISHENSVRSITHDVNSIVEKPDLSPIDQKPDYISANRRASEVKSNRPITTKPISDKSSKLNSKGGLSNITTKPIPSSIPPEDFQPSLARKRSIKDNWNAKKRDDVPSNSENSPDKSVQADQSTFTPN